MKKSKLPLKVEIQTSIKSLKILISRLGFFKTISILLKMRKDLASGKPFGHLSPPKDDSEHLTRLQAARAFVIYDVLKGHLGAEKALEITRELVVEGALFFLQATIPRLSRSQWLSMSLDKKTPFIKTVGERFFNADIQWETIDDHIVQFNVIHCHFVDLCIACRIPELAPLFCEGDALFFGREWSDVCLERPQVLSKGDPSCLFMLKWK